MISEAKRKAAEGEKPEPSKKSKHKKSSLKLREEFLNEIKNEENNINEQIFKEYFTYNSPSFLVKDLYEDNKIKKDIIVKHLNELLINLRNSINSKEITENENKKKSRYC